MTDIDYPQLNTIYQKYNSLGFQILAFPCAQFLNQEPGKNDEILNCLKYVRPGNGFVPLFPLFAKVLVNGVNISAIYIFLKTRCGPTTDVILDSTLVDWNPICIADITWNFEKFLVDKSGSPIKRYSPDTNPLALESDIQSLLNGFTLN